jgi:hypothetical protein
MAPSPSKTNFKTYDVQARLLRAIFAAHPDFKWDVKSKYLFLSLSDL